VRIAADAPSGGRRKQLALIDRDGTLPGRGAYLCRDHRPGASSLPDADCLRLAVRRGGIARTLRTGVTLAPELVESVGR
jgi:predicted RNA-binding protein YlxR (DUF448 family)